MAKRPVGHGAEEGERGERQQHIHFGVVPGVGAAAGSPRVEPGIESGVGRNPRGRGGIQGGGERSGGGDRGHVPDAARGGEPGPGRGGSDIVDPVVAEALVAPEVVPDAVAQLGGPGADGPQKQAAVGRASQAVQRAHLRAGVGVDRQPAARRGVIAEEPLSGGGHPEPATVEQQAADPAAGVFPVRVEERRGAAVLADLHPGAE